MRLFKPSDFISGETEEGLNYHYCVMCNGLEIQIESISWGWIIGVYSMYGRLIVEEKQPFFLTLAGGINYDASHEAMFVTVSKLYDRALSYKQIAVKTT